MRNASGDVIAVAVVWSRFTERRESSPSGWSPWSHKFSGSNANVYSLSAAARLTRVTFPGQISFVFRPSAPELRFALSPGQSFQTACLCLWPCPGVAAQPGAIALSPPDDHLAASCHVNLVRCETIRAIGGKCIKESSVFLSRCAHTWVKVTCSNSSFYCNKKEDNI